jgi:hypothetical protein
MKIKPIGKILFVVLLALVGIFIFVRKGKNIPVPETVGIVDSTNVSPIPGENGSEVIIRNTGDSFHIAPTDSTKRIVIMTPLSPVNSVKVHINQKTEKPKVQPKQSVHPTKAKKPGERENLELSN